MSWPSGTEPSDRAPKPGQPAGDDFDWPDSCLRTYDVVHPLAARRSGGILATDVTW